MVLTVTSQDVCLYCSVCYIVIQVLDIVNKEQLKLTSVLTTHHHLYVYIVSCLPVLVVAIGTTLAVTLR